MDALTCSQEQQELDDRNLSENHSHTENKRKDMCCTQQLRKGGRGGPRAVSECAKGTRRV